MLPGCLKSGGRSRSPAPMESVDRWPLASLLTDSRGEPLAGSRRSSACPRSLDPPPEGRMPQPASACKGDSWPGLPACGPVPGGLQWGQLDGHLCTPGAPGVSLWPGTSCAPSRVKPTLHAASSEALGCGLRCVSTGCAPGHTLQELGIWLILPVVICLSQRLSHACLSISTLYCETANGSLNQLSFI